MKIKNLKELNGVKSGAFTIVVDEEKNGLAITGRFSKGDTLVYFKELDRISEIIEDIKVFNFEVELEEKRMFKILFDRSAERVVMTSKEVHNLTFKAYLKNNEITSIHYDEIIERFRGDARYLIFEVYLDETN